MESMTFNFGKLNWAWGVAHVYEDGETTYTLYNSNSDMVYDTSKWRPGNYNTYYLTYSEMPYLWERYIVKAIGLKYYRIERFSYNRRGRITAHSIYLSNCMTGKYFRKQYIG